jgi:hypothetical protein
VEWSDDGVTWYVGSMAFDASALLDSEEATISGISDVAPTATLLDMDANQTFAQISGVPTLLVGPDLLSPGDYGGLGRVAGDVKIKGLPDVPVSRMVRLHREVDGAPVAQTISDSVTGAYEFLWINPTYTYTVISYDLPDGFRAAIASGVIPEPIDV